MARILIVDDDPTSRLKLKTLFERQGHEAVLTEDADEALSELEEGEFDLVIAEEDLPKVSGADLLRKVRDNTDLVPFILCAEHVDRPLQKMCLEFEAHLFDLTKRNEDIMVLVDVILAN